MNRLLFSAGVSNDKSLKNGNLDTLSTHSNESDSSLNASNNNESISNKQAITCEECKENCDDLNQFIMHLKNCKSTSGQNTQLLNLIVAAAQQQQQQQDEQSNQNLEDDDGEEDKLMVNETLENEDIDEKLNGNLKDKNKTPERTDSRQSTSSSIDNNSNGNNSKCTTPQLNGQSPTKTTSPTKEKSDKKSGSVLSALEQLIEKSFDPKSKKSTNNQGILQRLGT